MGEMLRIDDDDDHQGRCRFRTDPDDDDDVKDYDYVTGISGRLRVRPGGSHLTARPELRCRYRT